MIVERIIPFFLVFLLILFSVIEINAAVITYGTQLLSYALILFISFFYYHYLNKNNIVFVLTLSLFLLGLAIWQYSYLEYKGIFWLNTVRTVYWISIFSLFYSFVSNQSLSLLEKVIRCIILICSLSVILQFISVYMFHSQIDFSILLGGEGVRSNYSGDSSIYYRPTGLTSEPAIHSGIMLGLLTLYYILNKKDKIPIFIGLISIFLTFSTLGAILALAFIFIVYNQGIKGFIFSLILLCIALFFIHDSLISRYEYFMSGDDGSNNVKLEVLEYLFSNFNYYTTGLGFSGKDDISPVFFEALYDLTYFLTPIVYFGIYIGGFIIIFSLGLLIKANFIFSEKILITLSLIKLSGPTFMFFNLFILILFIINKKRGAKS